MKKTKSVRSKSSEKMSQRSKHLPVRYGFPFLPVADEALTHYMRKVSEFPILTEDEEKKLVESYRVNKNRDAARELIQSNLRLVVKIALEYHHAVHNLMDAIQEGNIGLLKAVQMYDPGKGARLGCYASWWIRSYILKFIMDNFRLVRVGTSQAQKRLFFNLMREKRRIEALGYEPTEARKLLSDKFEVSETQIDEMSTRLSAHEASLDAPISPKDEGSNLYLVDMIEDGRPSPLKEVLSKERRELLIEKLRSFSKTLSKTEQIILKKRLLAEIPKTLQELGKEFGVTKERVRQLQNRLINKFREELKDWVEEYPLDES